MKTFLGQFFRDCKDYASLRGDYMDFNEFPKNETKIANLYLKAEADNDEIGKNAYMSMLMLRHWKDIQRLYEKCKTAIIGGETKDDFAIIVYNRIMYAMKYARSGGSWNKLDAKISAQAAINMAISTEIKNQFYFSNLDKHMANANTMSTSTVINGSSDDKAQTIEDLLPDESSGMSGYYSGVDDLVAYYVRHKQIRNAIVIDRMTSYQGDYTDLRAAKSLKNLPDNYEYIFASRFPVAYENLCTVVSQIKQSNSKKIKSYIELVKADLRSKPELVKCLRAH